MIPDHLDKFEFLFGDWNMESRIPKSFFSNAGTDTTVGLFIKILNDSHVLFEYATKSGGVAKVHSPGITN